VKRVCAFVLYAWRGGALFTGHRERERERGRERERVRKRE
jgi:hypothetical protein